MTDHTGAVLIVTHSQTQGDGRRPIRCRLGWHPWPDTWPEPRITPDIQHGPEGRQLLGYHWTSHRVCPGCRAIQTRAIPLKK